MPRQPPFGFGPTPVVNEAREAMMPGIAYVVGCREIKRVVVRSPDGAADDPVRMIDVAPAARFQPWLEGGLGEIEGASTAEGGVRLSVAESPEFAQAGVNGHVGLLVADGEEVFTQKQRARVILKHVVVGHRGVMNIGDVGDASGWAAGEVVVEGSGPRGVQLLDHAGGGEELEVEVRLVGKRPDDDAGMAVVVIHHCGRGRKRGKEIGWVVERAADPTKWRFYLYINAQPVGGVEQLGGWQ